MPVKINQNKLSPLKKIGLILFGLALLCTTELVVRVLPLEHFVNSQTDPYAGFSSYLRLFKVNNSGYAETSPEKLRWFNQQSFRAEKPAGTFRIFCLGGSTTYGRPFADRTSFAGWLRDILNRPDTPRQRMNFEVINAGGISYASYRILNICEEILRYSPDLLVIYTGHNEFLESRTYGEQNVSSGALNKTRTILRCSETFRILEQGINSLKDSPTVKPDKSSGILSPEVETILERSAGLELYRRDNEYEQRVFEHFRHNIQGMIELCKKNNVRIVFIDPLDNLKDFSPFKSQHSQSLSATGVAECDKDILTGINLLSQNRAAEADNYLQQALALDSLYAESYFFMGRTRYMLEQYSEAKKSFILARENDICPLRAKNEIHRALAESASAAGIEVIDLQEQFAERCAAGIPGAEIFLDHIHPTPEGHYLIAAAVAGWMQQEGLWDGTLPENPEQVISAELDSLPAEYYSKGSVNLAKVLIWAKKYREAYVFLDRQSEILDSSAEGQYLMGLALRQLGFEQPAISHLERALELSPEHPQVLNQLALAYDQLGMNEQAAAVFEKAIALYPDDANYLANYGFLLGRMGQNDRALGLLLKAEKINPHTPGLYSNLGLTLSSAGNIERALAAFDKGVELTPDDPQLYYNRGVSCLMKSDIEQAERDFLHAISLDPENAAARLNLGNIYQNTGRPGKALEELKMALLLAPERPEPYFNLALLYRNNGDSKALDEIKSLVAERFGDSVDIDKFLDQR